MRSLPILYLMLALGLAAQQPLNPPVPLVTVPGVPADSAGSNALTLLAAQRAQELGFPSAAVELYRNLLAQPGGDRARHTLALVTALLDDGRVAEAGRELDGFVGRKGAAWQLRAGLVAAQERKFGEARAAVAGLKPDAFTAADRGWYFFLEGMLADAAGDPGQSRGFYEQAEAVATSDLARAQFLLAREQARLRTGPVDSTLAEEARRNMERLQGRKAGYGFARTYAAMLAALGRKSEAMDVLQRQLLALPPEERGEAVDFRLLLGLIAGAQDGAGRKALETLLAAGDDRGKQRVALQLLARASTDDPARALFKTELDGLIGATPANPILEDLLLVRAQLTLTAKDYQQAEADARTLLEKFPGSQLKAQAYGVLTGVAWEQRRYRAAADLATKARDELPAGRAEQIHAQLGVLVAEAWFRAHDYPNAADAYTAVVREVPDGVSPGALMFQRVLADIDAGRLDVAQQQLDALARDPRFDAISRWKAEWNLARALQAHDQTAAAFARLGRLLGAGPGGAGLPAELRARMAWLQARLSLEAGQPEQTLRLADALADSLRGIPDELSRQVLSSGALLKAEANFKLGRKDAAIELLGKLRADYPKSDATIHSYIVEAEYYAGQDQTVEAQRLYTKLADEFVGNQTYAPYALYQAALQAERRGQDANFIEANKLIEDLVTRYPNSPLVFYARLKQGDLLRKLNQFPQAQQVYENLVNNFPDHGDVILAQLALAECHNAQSMNDSNHAEQAVTLFEHLRDRVDAPVDVRVEAGFNLGYLMARRGQADRAEAVWWRDVVTAFLLDPAMAANLGPKGRYWMTRTLLELGSLYEQGSKLDQARDAWSIIIKHGLPGATLARDRLARFSPPATNP
ncbi:MAG: tetratricopeptide repeat protein [Opitutales bacterium]